MFSVNKEVNQLRQMHSLITAESLGNTQFKSDYGLRYAYIAGSMYKSISSKEMVIAMGQAGLLSYLGTGGMKYSDIESAIRSIQSALSNGQPYGLNLLYNLGQLDYEAQLIDLYLQYNVCCIEASAYMQVTPGLVRFRLSGLHRDENGKLVARHRILAKVSRPEVAEAFMRSAPESIVSRLLEKNEITQAQAELSQHVPVSNDICIETDSGGHTDMGVAYAVVPAIQRLRDRIVQEYDYQDAIRIGAAGGIGTPEAAAAAFVLGADFVLTGSINQCTVESGASDAVKGLLQDINVQDTDYAPAGDMFELGARVQVLKKGVFFPARANKLYALYQQYDSLDSLDVKTQRLLQDKYFKRSFSDIWDETRTYYQKTNPSEVEKAELNPKCKMALVFKWYFIHSARLALKGSTEQRVDYQVHTGPALGAFNQWVKGTELEAWQSRHVADIAERLMECTADVLNNRFKQFTKQAQLTNETT